MNELLFFVLGCVVGAIALACLQVYLRVMAGENLKTALRKSVAPGNGGGGVEER
jgi:hypothetical protein